MTFPCRSRPRLRLLPVDGVLDVLQRHLRVQVGGLGHRGVHLAGFDRLVLGRHAVVGHDHDVPGLPPRLEQVLLLEQLKGGGQVNARLHVDGVDGVAGEHRLQLRHRGGRVPLRRLGEDVHVGVLGLHALVERGRPVAAVDGGEVTLEHHHVALALEGGADVVAGLLAVGHVVGPHHHVDLAAVRAGVHRHHRDLLARQLLQRGQHGRGVLRCDDDALGPLRHQRLHVRLQLADVVLASWSSSARRPPSSPSAART